MESDSRCPKCNNYRFYNNGKCQNCGYDKNAADIDIFPGFFS